MTVDYNLSQIKQVSELDKKEKGKWIVMPRDFSNLGYDLAISPGRLAYSPAVEKAGKTLDLNLKNTAKDSLNRYFVGRIKWNQAMKLNLLMGNRSLMPIEAVNFWYLLNEGAKENIAVHTNDGKKLKIEDLKKIRNDVIKSKSPARGEWLDANFEKNENGFYLNSNHILQNNELVPKYSKEVMKNTLRKGKGISIESLFETKNTQGFPTRKNNLFSRKKTKKGNINYFPPVEDHNDLVGRIYTGNDWSDIGFRWNPFVSIPDLGIRPVEQLK